jgi:hypothetical protein
MSQCHRVRVLKEARLQKTIGRRESSQVTQETTASNGVACMHFPAILTAEPNIQPHTCIKQTLCHEENILRCNDRPHLAMDFLLFNG